MNRPRFLKPFSEEFVAGLSNAPGVPIFLGSIDSPNVFYGDTSCGVHVFVKSFGDLRALRGVWFVFRSFLRV